MLKLCKGGAEPPSNAGRLAARECDPVEDEEPEVEPTAVDVAIENVIALSRYAAAEQIRQQGRPGQFRLDTIHAVHLGVAAAAIIDAIGECIGRVDAEDAKQAGGLRRVILNRTQETLAESGL